MAVVTKSPSRGRATIPEAPEGTYEAVASKYAEQFRNAQRQQKQNQLNAKLLQWQRGDLDYGDLKQYLKDRIDDAKDNSSQKIELMQTLNSVDEQQTKIRELENQQRVADKRTELIEKYKDKGISNQEQLTIINELKKVANEDSDVYADLIEQEAQVRGAIEDERTSGSGKAVGNQLKTAIADIESAENEAEFAYQQGDITGRARDQIRLQHARELENIVDQYQAAGRSVPEDILRQARSFRSGSEEMLRLREQGLMADTINQDGEVVRVATNDRNFGREITFSPSQGVEMGGLADISGAVNYNPMLDQYEVEGIELPFTNRQEALQAARDRGLLSFQVMIPDPNKQIEATDPTTGETRIISGTKPVRMTKDPDTGVFYETDNPQNVYAVLPSSVEDLQNFKIENVPQNWQEQDDYNQQLQGMVRQVRGDEENIDLTLDLPERMPATQGMGAEEDRGFFNRLKEGFGKVTGEIKEEMTKTKPSKKFEAAKDIAEFGISPIGKLTQEATERAGEGIRSLFRPEEAGAVGPQIRPRGFARSEEPRQSRVTPQFSTQRDIQTPEINVPDINVSDFKIPSFQPKEIFSDITRNVRESFKREPQQSTPRQTEKQGIGSKIKDFGQRAWSGIKGLFGG